MTENSGFNIEEVKVNKTQSEHSKETPFYRVLSK